MHTWRTAWRDGFAPQLSVAALDALARALVTNDPRLIQGATSVPPSLHCFQHSPVEAACPLGYCGWQGHGLQTVGATEDFFARLCIEADRCLGEPAACRWFLNWYDDTPRDEMRRLLLPEVNRALAQRSLGASDWDSEAGTVSEAVAFSPAPRGEGACSAACGQPF
jgi:hypothetical protein